EDVFHLLDREREVVVGVERAAVNFRPPVLAGQARAGRSRPGHAAERVANALHALVVVGRSHATRLDADLAALRLDLLDELRDVHADLIVVRADVGETQVLVLRQKVGVPGQDRDALFLRRRKNARHRGGVGRRHANAVDALRDQVGDDLRFLVTAAVLAGAGEEALDLVGPDFLD